MPAKLLQSCLTLCDPMDYSLPGSPVHGILQARILEWVAMPSSRGSSRPRDGTRISYVSCIGWQIFTTSATWEAGSPALPGDSLPTELQGKLPRNQYEDNQKNFEKECISSVTFSSVTQLRLTLQPHGLQHARPPSPSPTPRAYSNSCPLSQ